MKLLDFIKFFQGKALFYPLSWTRETSLFSKSNFVFFRSSTLSFFCFDYNIYQWW